MSTSAPARLEPRRAYRDTQAPVLGGVAAGVARHVGAPVVWVRAAFLLATTLGGFGVALYGALWAFLPAEPPPELTGDEPPGLAGARRDGRRPGRARRLADLGPAVALAALGVGALLLLDAVLGTGGLFWPLALGLAGVALVWRQADEAQRECWLDTTGRADPVRAVFGSGGVAAYARVSLGGLLVLAALAVVALRDGSAAAAREGLVVGLLGVAGLALVVGPWVLRLAGDLTAERAERIRSQERADVAAHLHDSVLQTLALIQVNAGDPAAVARLARAQERDLRTWLYAGRVADDETVAAAVRAAAAGVEDAHGVVVEVVAVGDAPLTESLRPVVLATREAVVNAARHAGTGHVDVFVEVAPGSVEVFVRDRGRGFDPAAVPEDRHGVRGSILDRVRRHGGEAEVRSSPGQGTEVRLRMPREEQHGDG
ncbi:ATP-binding protein [Nocardioides perillae]|uniref:Signal transduction histidine kinase/phage shock protein PspC (Stress-responsive transcriptional regulator) n=1 Tax=Nocardioides perillae TaxID=1119534 RepID=A0A7Y9RUX7_9ACTN|nr:ATP-binding protein [Nocardioides perillae]NYG55073.1 signal transduction histidine kinase/phage shock protein PspC (stress-responsive transcriptional regulator) [Nocardioides perillae]